MMKPRTRLGWILQAVLVTGLVSAAISVIFLLLLYFTTEHYRVFTNDILPPPDWRLFREDPVTWQLLGIWLFLVMVVTYLLAALYARAGHWRLIAILLFVLAFILSRGLVIHTRLQNCISSCANHSSFWGPFEFTGDVPLTNSTEFADFIKQMHGEDKFPEHRYCPGRRRAGTKTGVVFVGGGLDLGALRGTNVLVAFCSWKSHPPPYDHQHYMMWEWANVNNVYRGIFDSHNCADTTDMIKLIEHALQQADSGIVPYSQEAVAILRYELIKRQKLW